MKKKPPPAVPTVQGVSSPGPSTEAVHPLKSPVSKPPLRMASPLGSERSESALKLP